jgi:curli biogenesis system outer membrane secretion channel CsgG
MKPNRLVIVILAFILGGQSLVRGQDMDTAISSLATNLASAIKNQGKKKVAVIDFSDLAGGSTELGKYIAEQLTVDLVMARRDFSVLDRGNLQKILAEHKLTATGLVDPDNAKKLGQFAGVDAIILGTVTPKRQNVAVTAKIITTDTAEIVGAGKAQFKMDDTVQELVSKQAGGGDSGSSDATADDKPKVAKRIGDLRVELPSLKMVDSRQLLLSMNLVNLNSNRSIFVALNGDMMNTPQAALRDDAGSEFASGPYDRGVSGIPSIMYSQYGYQGPGFSKAVQIRPGDSITATVKFLSRNGRVAEPKQYSVQMEFIISYDFNNGFGRGTVNNFSAKIKAE